MRFENILDIKFILQKIKEDNKLADERYKECVRNSVFKCCTCRFSKDIKYKSRVMTDCLFYGRIYCDTDCCKRYNIRRSDKKYLTKEQLEKLK